MEAPVGALDIFIESPVAALDVYMQTPDTSPESPIEIELTGGSIEIELI